jgi:hypothetical protein
VPSPVGAWDPVGVARFLALQDPRAVHPALGSRSRGIVPATGESTGWCAEVREADVPARGNQRHSRSGVGHVTTPAQGPSTPGRQGYAPRSRILRYLVLGLGRRRRTLLHWPATVAAFRHGETPHSPRCRHDAVAPNNGARRASQALRACRLSSHHYAQCHAEAAQWFRDRMSVIGGYCCEGIFPATRRSPRGRVKG